MSAEARIGMLLASGYGIEPVSVGPAPRGFVAETFAARLDGGRSVFVKWLPAWADAHQVAAIRDGLAVAERLGALGLAVGRPLRTTVGALWAELDERTVAVFDFIDGQRGRVIDQRLGPSSFNYDFEAFVALLAQVHDATSALDIALPRETFSLPFARKFDQAFRATFSSPPKSDSHAAMVALLEPYREQIQLDWADLRRLAGASGKTARTPVLTHGDLAGDNLIAGADGRLYAIDWDYPLLAPAERDSWFFTCDVDAEAAFLEAYRRVWPDYDVDPLLRRFYLFSRFFEDIYGYIDIVLGSDPPDRKAWMLGELKKTCFEWLWPPMRRL